MILCMILERNPKNEPFDIDQIINQTVEKYHEKTGNDLENFCAEEKTVALVYLVRIILDN